MGRNSYVHYDEFYRQWKNTEKELREAGAGQRVIDAMKEYDRSVFVSEQKYRHFICGDIDEEVIPSAQADDECPYYEDLNWLYFMDSEDMQKAIEDLGSDYIRFIDLCFIRGCTAEEACRMMGISRGRAETMKKKIREALEKFRNPRSC